MVLFSNLPAPWRSSFVSDVIIPSGVLQHTSADRCTPELYVISGRVETPAEYDMSGDLVVVNPSRQELLAAARVKLQLRQLHVSSGCVEVPTVSPSCGEHPDTERMHIAHEEDVARFLDYPVALSECRDPMVEVRV